MVPLLRQCGGPAEIHRVFDGDLVAQPSTFLRERQALDRVLVRARRHVHTVAGGVRLVGDRIDHERIAFPTSDGVAVPRRFDARRMLRGHLDRAYDMVAQVVEVQHASFTVVPRTELIC